jgi:hypothetical protein
LVLESALTARVALLIVRFWMFEVPPPGPGVITVMAAVPAAARSLPGIAAVSCVDDTNVVVRVEPANRTTEVVTKFDPFTVRVNAPSPYVLLVGEILVVAGAGALEIVIAPLGLTADVSELALVLTLKVLAG